MRCLCRPGRACFFFFCPFFARPPYLSPLQGGAGFFSPLPLDLPTTGSYGFNGAGNPFSWYRSPTRLSKPHTGPYTGFSRFCSHSPYLSPTGKGWPVRELGCHGLVDSPTTGSHGSNRAGNLFRWCCFPTWLPKPHTGPHGAEFIFSPQNEFTLPL